MNDRYLFKAKRADNGEWVYGNLIWSDDCVDDYRAIIIPTNNSNMFTKGGAKGDLGFENWYRVNENTICQCTNLKDKNGKLIWENDIAKDEKGNFYKSIWQDNFYKFCWVCIKSNIKVCVGNKWDLWDSIKGFEIEVVGNIFDNPELLESEI